MPLNRFASHQHGPNSPALGAYAVTPNNGADLPEIIRAVTIGTAGALAWRGLDGATYTTAALPVGTYPLVAVRIMATGTTAAGITGWV